ncbi:MAG: right-handed parallel beta-helix repeat-containing protein [Pseudomonadota bacterium]
MILAPLLLVACTTPLADLEDAHRDLTAALPVFPGAEGFGTDTPAGRGGEVLRVTTLDDSGPGSLREALSTPGPRTVIFDVSGTLWLTEELLVEEPFLTLAGQSAPSPGVTLAGAGLVIRTHDVFVQHLRIRPGDREEGPDPEDRDALKIIGGEQGEIDVYGVVVDHCSLSWATDENASTWYPGVRDVTFSHNLIAEGLWYSRHPEGLHSMGLLVGDHTRRAAVIRNVFAHNNHRNPQSKHDVSLLVANNLVYDPGDGVVTFSGARFCCPSLASLQGNLRIDGAATQPDLADVYVARSTHRDSRVFVEDSGSKWTEVDGVWAAQPPVGVAPLSLVEAAAVEGLLLDAVGARPLDRDAVDTRIVAEIRARGGGPLDSQDEVGGWPTLAESTDPLELPEYPSADHDGDGYTDLEELLHALAEAVGG